MESSSNRFCSRVFLDPMVSMAYKLAKDTTESNPHFAGNLWATNQPKQNNTAARPAPPD
jgi:hypothetical protein